MCTDAHNLKPLDFFADFKQDELEACATALTSGAVKAGESIIEHGTSALTLFIIPSGTCELNFKGDRSVLLDQFF